MSSHLRLASLLVAASAITVTPACSDPASSGETDESNITSTVEHRLEGFDETVLVGALDGRLALVHVGESATREDLAAPFPAAPVVARSHGQKFFLVYEDAKTLVRVDPAKASIDKTVRLPVNAPADIELIDGEHGWVSSKTEGRVAKVDLTSGAELATIDLGASRVGDGTIQPRRLKVLGDRLFVQIARATANGRVAQGAVAVIDVKTDRLEEVVELEGRDASSGSDISGFEPDLPFIFDAKRNRLLVTATGNRPSNTGLLARLNPQTLTIDTVERSRTFQGAVAFDHSFDRMFLVEHTSTPVTSSHLIPIDVDEDGNLHPVQGAPLIDAFDGTDAIAMNPSGTLLAMANSCLLGFCFDGAGVSFVDARTREVLPKLMSDAIGFEPILVEFE